jgi:uncharacterized repeat protein (TIGR01451 family)
MKLSRIVFFVAWAAFLAAAQPVEAAGTAANTDISNSASVTYSVGGVGQPAVNSNTVTFKVDRRINLTVAEVGGAYTDVAPGQTNQVLTFTVTNSTNDTVDFRLLYTQDATTTADPFGGTDDFDTSNVRIYLDDGDSVFDGGDTLITFLDNVPADANRRVYVVSDIPASQPNGDTSSGTLTAIASTDGSAAGNDYTETAGADTPGAVDTVFGDGAGDTDAARDGRHSDDDAYRVVAATITVTKTSRVVSDPFNGATNPKAIPGAVIEFCIQVSNTGGTSATNVVVNDAVPGNTTFVAGSIFAAGTVTAGACNADGTAEDDDNAGADETDPNGGNITAGTVSTMVPSVAAGATTASRFRVTIN